jgi:hypothetical protein
MKKFPWACSLNLAVIERTMARSSARSAMCGNISVISIPDCPRFFVSQCGAWILPLASNWVRSTGIGIGFPSSFFKRGFGSKESTWEKPPDM